MLIKSTSNLQHARKAVFKELQKGSSDSRHPFRYVSLATIDAQQNEPNIRMMILRELQKDQSVILYTDSRTEKVEELKSAPKASLLLWHEHHKVQLTFKAEVEIHQGNELAEHYWKSDVHGAARKAYTPVVEPGTSIDDPKEAHRWPEEYTKEHFCVLKCIPYRMQILQLGGKEHFRLQFTREAADGEWQGGWIAP